MERRWNSHAMESRRNPQAAENRKLSKVVECRELCPCSQEQYEAYFFGRGALYRVIDLRCKKQLCFNSELLVLIFT